ncbi:MAG: hypothetical protein HY748_00330 [Elusimicrobia bacterium]|nr:hypothetical protein [Elusimicrobiota bacterium]
MTLPKKATVAALLLAVASAAAGCSREKRMMPDIRLPTLAGDRAVSLAECPAPKCLTICLAPWCGNCRTHTPTFLGLRDLLAGRGVVTRFVVGMDRLDDVKSYARELGPDTLLDPDGQFPTSGIPSFTVSDASGTVLNTARGVPSFVKNDKALAWYLGLD